MKKYIISFILVCIVSLSAYAQIDTRTPYNLIELAKQPIDYSKFTKTVTGTDTIYLYNPEFITLSEDNTNVPNVNGQAFNRNISASYDLNFIPNTFQVDVSKDVGEINIQQSTDDRGNLIYSVPIVAYSTPTSFNPSIELIYNSASGSSLIGKGWQLGGVSAITITNKSIYYDGNASPGKRNTESAFSLDGNRLIKTGVSGSNINYETEFSSIKVTAVVTNGQIKYFKVQFPNGSEGIYGFTDNTTTKDCYPMTEISDALGNYATYAYQLLDNIYYVTNISYGGIKKASISHFAKITFGYETKPDKDVVFSDGLEIILNRRVKEISTYINNQLLRTYRFTYEFKNVSLLKQIDCVSNGKSFNPLIFYYGKNNTDIKFDAPDNLLVKYFTKDKVPKVLLQKAKFLPYKQYDALIAYPLRSNYTKIGENKNIFGQVTGHLFGTEYRPADELAIYYELGSGSSYPAITTAGEGFIQMVSLDIDGDGCDEIVKMNYKVVDKKTERVTYTIYDVIYTMGQTVLKQRNTFTADFGGIVESGSLYSPVAKMYLFGDFLGNGKQNIVSISYWKDFHDRQSHSMATLVDIEGKKKSPTHDKKCFNLDFEDYLFAFDFDGDGKADICHINADGAKIYSFDSSGSLVQIGSYSGITSSYLKDRQLLIGDINGDGKTDLAISPKQNDFFMEYYSEPCFCPKCRGIATDLPAKCIKDIIYQRRVYRPTAYRWNIALSTGTTFDMNSRDICLNEGNPQFVLQDINGDGKSDLVKLDQNKISVYFAEKGLINSIADSKTISVAYDSRLIAANTHNGSEMAQLFCLNESSLRTIKYSYDQSEEQLLTGVITSHGVIHKHSYTSTKDPNAFYYEKGAVCKYPFVNISSKMHLYTGTNSYINNSVKSSNSYSYARGVANLEGRGFLGFETVKCTDLIKDVIATSTYDVLSYGELKKTDSPKETITYTYSYIIPQNRISKILVSKKSHLDKLRNINVNTTYSHDNYGNITKEYINYGANNTLKITDCLYNNYTSPYRIGVLYQKTTQQVKAGYTGFYEKEYVSAFTTDGTYLPKNIIYYINDVQVKDVINTYETNTNRLAKEDWRNYNSANRQVTQYIYDSYGRITKKTDPLGLSNTYGYNIKGELISETNHMSKVKSYQYDDWGRLTKSTLPTGEVITNASDWTKDLTDALYNFETKSNARPATKIYYDALGRELRKREMRFDGRYLSSDTKYNHKGNIEKTSLPFTGSTPAFWTNYTYDNHDRVKTITYGTGRADSYTYYSDYTEIIVNGVKRTEKYDVQGQVKSITDPGGLITYELRPDGKPSSVTSVGIITTFEYDTSGRQTAIVDPSAGRKTFTYDAAGNLSEETNANGKKLKLGYDTKNRLIRKEFVGDQTITYTYNTDNFLTSEVSTNGTSTYYTPDALLRTNKIKETGADNTWLQKEYIYNAFGNPSKVLYTANTGSITEETYHYLNGTLSEIQAGATSIWKLTQEDSMGQRSEVKSNNSTLVHTYSYDNNGFPKTRTVKYGSNVIQDYTYSFNPQTGNLTFRKDNKRNLQDNFTYDGLHRLSTYSGRTTSYDNRGNITGISNIGTMAYNDTKPYAIEYLTPTSGDYKQRQQLVTYNAMLRPATIVENGYTASFVYNGNDKRVKMSVNKNNANELTRYYLGSCYEKDTGVAGTKEKLYLGGDAYTAMAVMVKQGTGNWALHYICRDYLGNITHLTNTAGTLVQELSYDPYGRLRNPDNHTLYAIGSEPALFLGRGYTGHEHMPWFGLINMNARLYDSALGRFMSPDPYIQLPYYSQNYNRYSYVLNNPLIYNDPNGELIFLFMNYVKDFFVNTFIRSWDKGINAWTNPNYWRSTTNAAKIDVGLFMQIPVWETIQTGVGYIAAQSRNVVGQVDNVELDWKHFAVLVNQNTSSNSTWGFTAGPYINSQNMRVGDAIYMHELGHRHQSLILGITYPFVVMIPSFITYRFFRDKHDDMFYEKWADKLGGV